MADNILESIQKLLQDLIVPDVRETRVRLDALEKRIDAQFDSMRKEGESMRKENEANYRSLMSAIGELKANSEALTLREVAAVRERVAVLEAQNRPH